MTAAPGHKLTGLPLGELNLINELLDFDGNPLLLHLSNDKGDDILAYWIDFANSVNRWMYFKVSKRDLYLYLFNKVSLKFIQENIQAEYLFILDKEENSILTISMISRFEIPEKYIPSDTSFFNEDVPEFYLDYLKEIHFQQLIIDRSFVFKSEPTDGSHGNFVFAKSGASLLASVSKSTEAYVAINAKKKYRTKYSSESRVNKISKTFETQLSPLISHAVINSFEVWLSMDTITLNNVDELGSELKSEILEGYKRDVLDVDFSSEEDAKIICEKFDAVERKKIYGPILDILEDEDVNITISDRQGSIRETGHPVKVSSAFADLILPKPTIEELTEELERKKSIYTLVLTLKEGTDISRLSKKQILDNLLTYGNDIEVPFKIPSPINVEDQSFDLKKPIVASLRILDGDNIEISYPDFEILVTGKDIQQLNEELRLQFLRFIIPYLQESKADLQTLNKLSEYLDVDKYKKRFQ